MNNDRQGSHYDLSAARPEVTGQDSWTTNLSVMRLTVEVRCEKKILMKLAVSLCAMAQSESLHSSELKFGDLGDFKLENGAVIRDCRIAYHTSGS